MIYSKIVQCYEKYTNRQMLLNYRQIIKSVFTYDFIKFNFVCMSVWKVCAFSFKVSLGLYLSDSWLVPDLTLGLPK